MKKSKQFVRVSENLIALAVLAAFAPAHAQDIAELTAPGNSISVGASAATGNEKDRARFGLYNGLRRGDINGLMGFSYTDRDANTGKWFSVEGRNLGLDNRELGFSYRKLGDLKLWGEYSEITRHDPRAINTGLVGAGTTMPSVTLVTAGRGADLNLELKRKAFSLNAEKWFGGNLQLEVNFKNEDKNGARFFGKGFACSATWVTAGSCTAATQWALLMVPEPVNSTIRQLDAKLNYTDGRLNLSGGYYGSFYTNQNGNLDPTIPGSLNNPLGASQVLDVGLGTTLGLPMALSPDNQSQQIFLGGNYALTHSTKLNFKYSYAHATQTENFLAMGLSGAPAGRPDLGGKVDTTRAVLGFTSHPLDKLHVHGDLKYDKRNNSTPIAYYNVEGTSSFTNGAPSPTKWDGKLETSYALPADYTATAGVFYEKDNHGTFTSTSSVAGLSGIRQNSEEKGYRLELRKSMSETLTGWLSYSDARRAGTSSWLKPNTLPTTGVAAVTDAAIYSSTAIFPFMFMDRDRSKWKAMANWAPMERLSLTFFLEDGRDQYHAPTLHGLRDTGYRMYSGDASYALSDDWKLSAYGSYGQQTVHAGHSNGYDAELQDSSTSFGLGITGKPSSRFQVGADAIYLNDVLRYNQACDPTCSATNSGFLASSGGLPDVTYQLLRLKLFGQYALDKTSYVRFDLIHENTKFNEWTYSYNGTPFVYSDGTTLTAKQNQSVTFLGVSYVLKFQ